MNHAGHEILKCYYCTTVIRQCRCADKNKPTRMTACAWCSEQVVSGKRAENTRPQPKESGE